MYEGYCVIIMNIDWFKNTKFSSNLKGRDKGFKNKDKSNRSRTKRRKHCNYEIK